MIILEDKGKGGLEGKSKNGLVGENTYVFEGKASKYFKAGYVRIEGRAHTDLKERARTLGLLKYKYLKSAYNSRILYDVEIQYVPVGVIYL